MFVLFYLHTPAGERTQYDRIVKTVLKVWNDWAASEKLTALYSALKAVARSIVADGGGNRFELTHFKNPRGPRGSYQKPVADRMTKRRRKEDIFLMVWHLRDSILIQLILIAIWSDFKSRGIV